MWKHNFTIIIIIVHDLAKCLIENIRDLLFLLLDNNIYYAIRVIVYKLILGLIRLLFWQFLDVTIATINRRRSLLQNKIHTQP